MDTTVPRLRFRIGARVVDAITVFTWVWALSVAHILFYIPIWSEDVAPSPWGDTFLFTVTFAVVYVAYEVLFVARTGATPGKDLCRLKVVDAATGETPTIAQAIRRAVPLGIVWLVPGMWPGAVMTGLLGSTGLTDRDDGRTIHDRLSTTRVIRAPEPELEPGTSVEEAEAERRAHFVPRFVNPIQLLPSQMLRHPGTGPSSDRDDEPDAGRRR